MNKISIYTLFAASTLAAPAMALNDDELLERDKALFENCVVQAVPAFLPPGRKRSENAIKENYPIIMPTWLPGQGNYPRVAIGYDLGNLNVTIYATDKFYRENDLSSMWPGVLVYTYTSDPASKDMTREHFVADVNAVPAAYRRGGEAKYSYTFNNLDSEQARNHPSGANIEAIYDILLGCQFRYTYKSNNQPVKSPAAPNPADLGKD